MASDKVLQAIGTIDAIGGAQRQVLAVSAVLDPTRVRSDVAWFLGKGELAAEFRATGARVADLSGRVWDPIGVARATAAMVRERYDVVHCHLSRAEIVAGAAAMLARAAGAPRPALILHKHNEDSWWRGAALGAVHRALTARADAVVVQSPRLADFYADPALHVSHPSRIVVVPYGIDAATFRVDPDHRAGARARIRAGERWDPAAPIVLVIARIVPQKRLDVLLEAWGTVSREVPEARLLIAGRGELQDELARHAPPSVRFAGFRSDIADLLAASDALAISSDWEGVPMAMLQAMAARLPIVSTDVAGIADAVTDGKEALLVPPRDPARLSAALIDTLRDPAAAHRRAIAAEARVLRDFSIAAAARAWEQLYARF